MFTTSQTMNFFDRTAQEKLANIQEKLQNKNLSNKRRKELKKSKNKIAGDERKRKEKKRRAPCEEKRMRRRFTGRYTTCRAEQFRSSIGRLIFHIGRGAEPALKGG